MRNVKRTLVAAALTMAALGAAGALARPRSASVYSGAHAQAMSRIYQANQQHNAVIDQVQRNINESEHRY